MYGWFFLLACPLGVLILRPLTERVVWSNIRRREGRIDLVILDLIMPGMGGMRCLEELLRMNPKVKVVIASGYSVDGHTQEPLEAGAKNSVSKPYAIRQMPKVVREVLDED